MSILERQAARRGHAEQLVAMTGARGHTLDIDSVTHRYGPIAAVAEVSLAVSAGEIVALLGPSGCGKTTLLRVVAGFVRQSAGSVRIDGKPIDHLAANIRNVGIVFQNYALFPHMTVAQNVAYGLQARGRPREEVRRTVDRFLEVVRLTDFHDRLPRQLSGGQQQRVAVARALVVEPTVLLLDEPFSALDKSLRLDMQIEIKRLQRQFGLTVILVTHDQDEAMSVADRIAVMNHGRVEQFDTPINVYDRPATLFVSGFIGTTNLLAGRVLESSNGTTVVELEAGARLAVPTDRAFAAGTPVVLSVRPEQVCLHAESAPGRWSVRRRLALPLGSNTMHDLQTRDGATLKLVEPRIGVPEEMTAEAWCGLRPEAQPTLFDRATSM
jgi:putative spermidine/putrescine transport system ATP-binding protein